MTTIIGWDLGGANVKLALVEGTLVQRVMQLPCPILQTPAKFDAAVGAALALAPSSALHAVTMTGELSDVFADRREGVAYLVGLMRRAISGQTLLVYAGRAGFLDPDAAVSRWLDVASANWHASARLAARECGEGLFVDVGTTTTDLVPLKAGALAARGYTDGERLTEGELVYAGVVRTPVMAIAQAVLFGGRRQRIAGERFATMADVWRLTGELPDDADPYPTADQRGKSAEESAARLARMLGRDAAERNLVDWVALAWRLAQCQLAQLEDAALILSAREGLGPDAPMIGAGCGRFLAKHLAQALGRPYVDCAELIGAAPDAREGAARCAPAVAVALLAVAPVEKRGSNPGAERNC
jgi:probable H4MPT-linked C1 transfer pathway protein